MAVALVTGGTRRLGAVIAARLARDGHELALHYRRSGDLDPALARTLEDTGAAWQAFPGDFADDGAAPAVFAAARQRFGAPVQILVNSASRFGKDTPETVSADTLADHFRINAAAPALLAQAMSAQEDLKQGAIVNLLDQRLAQPHADNFAYTVSKYALAGLTEILARTLAPRIRVNAVAPGLVLPTEAYDEDRLARVRAQMPLGRLSDAQEVADAVSYLVGAEGVTGETIHVDAGARHRAYGSDFDAL